MNARCSAYDPFRRAAGRHSSGERPRLNSHCDDAAADGSESQLRPGKKPVWGIGWLTWQNKLFQASN